MRASPLVKTSDGGDGGGYGMGGGARGGMGGDGDGGGGFKRKFEGCLISCLMRVYVRAHKKSLNHFGGFFHVQGGCLIQ